MLAVFVEMGGGASFVEPGLGLTARSWVPASGCFRPLELTAGAGWGGFSSMPDMIPFALIAFPTITIPFDLAPK